MVLFIGQMFLYNYFPKEKWRSETAEKEIKFPKREIYIEFCEKFLRKL